MQAAVHATEERLTASQYLMRISAHLAFSSTKHVCLSLLLVCKTLVSIYWLHLKVKYDFH